VPRYVLSFCWTTIVPDTVISQSFPSYVGEAADKTEPKDADIPATRIPGAQPAGV
jgi:hypothetical protein